MPVSGEQSATTAAPDGSSAVGRTGVRDRFWFQLLLVVLLVAGLVLAVTRFAHRDVVQGWQVLAACPADPGTAPATVTTTLDTSACATAPSHAVSGRGWPIVPFVLPADAGLDPSVTTVVSDRRTRTMRAEYQPATGPVADAGRGVVLVFVEVPAEDLPATPFTIEGASGPVTVTAASTS